jgi:hypothetical protein
LRCPRFEERRALAGKEIGRESPRIGSSQIQDGGG